MSESTPKRRLPFKPTALRKPKSATAPQVANPGEDGADNDLALFQRSKQMMPMMAAEAERRVRREKEKEEARRRRGGTATGSEEPGSAQKRRASEDWDDAGRPTTPSRQPSTPTSSSSKRRHGCSASPTQLTTPTRAPYSSTPMPPPSQDDTITILDEDDDDDVPTQTLPADSSYKDTVPRWVTKSLSNGTTSLSTPAIDMASVEIVKDSDDDDEVEEVLVPSEEETDPDLQVFINAARQRLAESQESEPSSEETFKVQVESAIPGTAPADGKTLTFKLSASGPLGDLKTAWCAVLRIQHVELSHADVFFTWRGRRLYNTTTLGGLGVATMGNELLYAGDAGDRRGLSADRKKVVLKAWTEALYEEHVKSEERERLRRLGELDDDDGPGGADAAAAAAPQEPRVRVTMRARQGEPVKVSVTASSTVGDLVAKFREKRNLPADAKVSIHFDGERLDEGTTLEDADIGDEEQVEVHLS